MSAAQPFILQGVGAKYVAAQDYSHLRSAGLLPALGALARRAIVRGEMAVVKTINSTAVVMHRQRLTAVGKAPALVMNHQVDGIDRLELGPVCDKRCLAAVSVPIMDWSKTMHRGGAETGGRQKNREKE